TTAYPIFVYAGVLPWTFFSTGLAAAAQSLISSNNLITKGYFPRLIVPFSSIGAGLIDFGISFMVMFGLMAYYGIGLGVGVLMLPLLVAGTVIAALGFGTLLAALTVTYRDFRYVITFLLQIWMFAT